MPHYSSPLRAGYFAVTAAILALVATAVRATEPAPFIPLLPATNHTGGAVVIVPSAPASGSATAAANQLARWLNERGVAAFILRDIAPTADASASIATLNRAIRTLRANAADFKISPTRIAVLGLGRGAEIASDAAYNHVLAAKSSVDAAADPLEKFSSRPDLLGLIWSGKLPADGAANLPPTFLAGTSTKADGATDMVALWSKLRATRTSVDLHLFPATDSTAGLAADNESLGTWPEMFFNWARFNGLLAEAPRLALKGLVYLDGHVLPHGYVILTPVGFAGAGPIIGRVINSTANLPIGEFSVPADQGPVAGRYKVDVRQNMNRWLSNSFMSALVQTRGGAATPEQLHFGHHRALSPSIDDQRSFTKARPTDQDDLIVEIKPGADANLAMKIEVFSGAVAATPAALAEAPGGIVGGPKNPGQTAYVEQLARMGSGPVAGIPAPILLWPAGAPEAVPDANGVFTDEDKPAIYAFPAPAGNNTGAAVLIVPGGGFTNRCMDNEGVQIAKFLNRHGIAGFVLRYRIGPVYPRRNVSTMDAHRAMRHLRANAASFKISPDKIGVIGFSAGGELLGDAFYNGVLEGDATAADPLDRFSTRANFSALIYGGRNVQNPASAPPTFLFNTIEDGGHLNVELSVLNSLRGAGVPVETHFNQVGPHGTAMSLGDPLLGDWPGLMVKWLRVGGFLGKKS